MVARIGNNNQNFINGVNPTLRSVSPSTDNAIMPKMKNPRFNPEATIADVVACFLLLAMIYKSTIDRLIVA